LPDAVKVVLNALAAEISRLESLPDGDSDEALYFSELAFRLRHWYHSYLFLQPVETSSVAPISPTVSIPSVTKPVGPQSSPNKMHAQHYHTAVDSPPPSLIAPQYVKEALYAQVQLIEKRQVELLNAGDEETVLDLNDDVMILRHCIFGETVPAFRDEFYTR